MKKLLLVSLVLVIASAAKQSHAQTNVYHPFPDSNAIWRWGCGGLSSNCCCSCSGICLNQSDYHDSIAGDTIIGSYTYKKLWRASVSKDYYTGQVTCAPWGYQSTIYSSVPYSYIGAIRQDTNQRKVFLYNGNNSDTLFYDFNLNLGDTLPPSAIMNSENYFVSKIDSTLIGGIYHKRFWLWNITNNPPTPSDSGNVAYIEGIGNTFGLFSPLFEPFESACELNCVQVNSLTIYPDSSYNCIPLDLTLSVNENENNSFGLTISPNPFSTQATVQITSSELRSTSYELEMYDVFGRMVKEFVIRSSPFVIERDNLPSGIYFILLEEEGKPIAAGKLVITSD